MSYSRNAQLQHDRHPGIDDWQPASLVDHGTSALTTLPPATTRQTIFGQLCDPLMSLGEGIVVEVEPAAPFVPFCSDQHVSYSSAHGVRCPVAASRVSLAPAQ